MLSSCELVVRILFSLAAACAFSSTSSSIRLVIVVSTLNPNSRRRSLENNLQNDGEAKILNEITFVEGIQWLFNIAYRASLRERAGKNS